MERSLYILIMTSTAHGSSGLVRVLLLPVIGFVAATAVFSAVTRIDGIGDWVYLAILIPVAPVLWAVQRLDRYVEQVDELQRLILLKSMASGFLITVALLVLVTTAQLAGIPGSPWMAAAAGLGGWVGTTIRTIRQYR